MMASSEQADSEGSLLEKIRALGPQLDARGGANQNATEISGETIAALKQLGVFGMMAPRELGGLECNPQTLISAIRELSYWDGSAGWFAAAVMTGGSISGAWLGPKAIEAMYRPGAGVPLSAGQAAPTGTAVREGDSYRISGSYSFGSGTPAADWIVGGFVVHENGQPVMLAPGVPRMLIAMVPRETVTFKGNWDVIGLRGTGSYDFTIHEQLLHEDFFYEPGATPQRHGGALYRMGFMALPCIHHASFPLGVAQRALDEWRKFAESKARAPGLMANQLHTFQRDFAAATAELRASEAYVRRTYEQLYAAAEAGHVPDGLRADGRLCACNAYAMAMRVVQAAFAGTTTFGIRDTNAIQRTFRDIQAGNAHFLTADMAFIDAGKWLAGIEGAQLVF